MNIISQGQRSLLSIDYIIFNSNNVLYVHEVYAVMVICDKHPKFDGSPRVRSGKDSVNVWNSYHRTECSKFWVRIPVEPVISFIWKVKMKVGRTRHDSFLCMCITYVKQCKCESWKIKSCLYGGQNSKIIRVNGP